MTSKNLITQTISRFLLVLTAAFTLGLTGCATSNLSAEEAQVREDRIEEKMNRNIRPRSANADIPSTSPVVR